MHKIVVFGIIYRNHSTLSGFISSIACSAMQAVNLHGQLSKVTLYLLDNSELTKEQSQNYKKEFENTNSLTINVIYLAMKNNLGYLGPLPFAQSLLKKMNEFSDIVIYSNTDILFDVNFFRKLEINYTGNVNKAELVAPSIIIKTSGFDQNPKYINKPKLAHLNFLKKIYSSFLLAVLYEAASFIKILLSLSLNFFTKASAYKDTSLQLSSYSIYAAHGACFIFADTSFFMSIPRYPIFLFGEELYIAELAAKKKFKTVYDPSLVVYDIRHSSISSLPNAKRVKLMHESIAYLCRWL